MATKRTPTKKTRPAKKATKKRTSKAPPKKRTSKAPATKAAKKHRSKPPAKSSRPTKPAKKRARKAVSAPASVPVPASAPVSASASASPRKEAAVPPPWAQAPSRPPSYLEGVPRDHAELAAALLQVARGAAKDIKTLVTQAIAMSNKKSDRFDR